MIEMTKDERKQHYANLINARRIIGGEVSELMAISPVKHAFARKVWRQMLDNTWFATEIDMSRDIDCYRNELDESERRAFDCNLAFLSNLDGIQLHNLSNNIGPQITSPEVKMVIDRQAYEEALHVEAYSTIVEAVSLDTMDIYMMFERDGMLAAKNEYIMRQSKLLGKEFSPRNFALAVVANIVLEGIYFYSGFLFFYALAKRGKMLNAADQIKFINRDEETHLAFFIEMFRELLKENPEVAADPTFWQDAKQLIMDGTEMEIAWGQYTIRDGVLGLSDKIVDQRIRFLANERATAIGIEAPYPGVANPVAWADKFAKINDEDSNFFEAKVKAYQVGGTLAW